MKSIAVVIVSLLLIAAAALNAAPEISGRVLFNGLAVPGAIVTATPATKDRRVVTTLSDDDGVFRFASLDDRAWTITVEMRGFVVVKRDVTVPLTEAASSSLTFALTMKPLAEMAARELSDVAQSEAPPLVVAAGSAGVASPKSDDTAAVINGSVINGAASAFAQARAFGNNRPMQSALYNGGITMLLGNSALNTQPYSFGGSAASIPSYSDVQLGFTLIGPLKIPWLVHSGPQTSFTFQHGVQHNATTQSALMPTAAQRAGDLSQSLTVVRDPLTGKPFAGNVIPLSRISPQAAALLAYYPMPNGLTSTGANYQAPVLGTTTQDNVQVGMQKSVTPLTNLSGSFSYFHTVTDSISLFNFNDTSRQSSLSASATWSRRYGRNTMARATYQFTRASASTTPYFADRVNVSGDAGIVGNSQASADWGPPALSFPDIVSLRDADYQSSVKMSHAIGGEVQMKHGRHNITIGGDMRRHAFDVSSQPDPRGTLSFTGAASGSAFGDFLLGVPTTTSIAFGNTAANLRGNSYDAYVSDDFRVGSGLTMNVGLRWEYESPFSETAGRLANLDVAPGFSAIRQVTGINSAGALTGTTFPKSLLRPDKRGLEPRISGAWRPVLGSSFVLRGSYGLYKNLGVYQSLGVLLAQQPPFSTTVSVQNTAAVPLTLTNPFPSSVPSANTFGIDPNLRTGLVHSWNLSAQRDLPGSLTVIAAYFGDRGTHLMQAFLPNTYPAGAVNPCTSCPSGFVFVTSNGTSLRNAGQFTIRRRLYAGFTATVQYTIAKSTDNAATFSNSVVNPTSLAIAQNWLDLDAERGPSSFDQRHVLSVQAQYTTGVGVTGGTLIDGVWGTLYKDWTVTAQLTAGSGLPFTPISFAAVAGTGVVGVRPSLTGVSTAPVSDGSYANPAAFAAPANSTWGNAGRNSLRGPSQFSLDATLSRVFRLHGRLNLESRVAATNVLNRVTFAAVDPVTTSPQFGRPTVANQMRRLQLTFRLKF